MKSKKVKRGWAGPAFCAAVILTAISPQARAAKDKDPLVEVWPGSRATLMLPLQVGAGWNIDPNVTRGLLPAAGRSVSRALTRTRKLSPLEPHRFNPLLQRALIEKRFTEDQLVALINTPSLETAGPVLSRMSFDQPPMIAQFILNEVRVGGDARKPTVQVQASGMLYEFGTAALPKNVTVTSIPVGGGTSDVGRVLGAIDNALMQIAYQFVEPPTALQLTRGGMNNKAPMPGMNMPGGTNMPAMPMMPTPPNATTPGIAMPGMNMPGMNMPGTAVPGTMSPRGRMTAPSSTSSGSASSATPPAAVEPSGPVETPAVEAPVEAPAIEAPVEIPAAPAAAE